MVAFSGRVEAKLTVPTGGAAVSCSTSAQSAAQTATVAAAPYYMTAAGGVSSLLATFQSALNTAAPPSSGAWSVAMSSTTGLVTISCDHPASVSWTSTALRDVLGFEYDFDYPQTAAQMAAALGYGTWTSGAGWLCNETAGDLAPAFGSVTLADSGTPTYSTQGPRGATDKAIGFTLATDNFGGGDVFDVTSTDDLAIVWVGYFSSNPAAIRSLFSKYAPPGWILSARTDGVIRLSLSDGSTALDASSTTSGCQPGEWHVGIACVDRSTGQARVGTIGLNTATSSAGSATSTIGHGNLSNATAFQVGDDAAGLFTAPGEFKLAAAYVVAGSGVATGLSANLSTALASFAASMKSQTGTKQARSVWFPDSPLNCDDHPSMAPDETDLRQSEGPTGVVLGLSGNVKYAHTNVRWERVPVSQIREASATYDNGSLEVFFRDAISGLGAHAWLGPSRQLQIWWSNQGTDVLLGADANDGAGAGGWTLVGARKFSDIARPSQRGWVGQFNVTFGRLVSPG